MAIRRWPRIGAALALACAVGTAQASVLQPIQVEADDFRVLVNENKAVWRGNVIATQGNFRFRASRLTIHLDQIADGSQESGAGSATARPKPRYELSARRLSYDVDADQVSGIGSCELRRGMESIHAERIVFDVDDQIAHAHPSADGRVRVEFMPNPEKPVFPSARPATAGFPAR